MNQSIPFDATSISLIPTRLLLIGQIPCKPENSFSVVCSNVGPT